MHPTAARLKARNAVFEAELESLLAALPAVQVRELSV